MTTLELVREALANAAENGHTFDGWPNAAVASDMMACDGALEGRGSSGVLAALVVIRGADVSCPYCPGGGACETCMGYGEVRP